METQARICPTCIDDHSSERPCKWTDLVERIELGLKPEIDRLRTQVAELEKDRDLLEWILKFHGNTREFVEELRGMYVRFTAGAAK